MTTHSTTAQVALYGEPWADRFTRIRTAYGLSQGTLAATVGLSAPMVSQLASGQRVKISNPAVLARIVFLEEHLTDPGVAGGDRARIEEVLAEVRGSTPLLRTTSVSATLDRAAAVEWMRAHGEPGDLTALADAALERGATAIADALREAGRAD